MTDNDLPISTVTQRDAQKSETLTAPNARPLLVQMIGNISCDQQGNAHSRLMHNHPSGDPTPSRADIDMTKAIVDVAKSLGIAVHDHIIVGKDGHTSLDGDQLVRPRGN